MYSAFSEIIQAVTSNPQKRRIAVAAAQDREVLSSAVQSRNMGLADFSLVGNAEAISAILTELDETPSNWDVIDEANEHKATAIAVEMVASGQADIPMKGLVHTSTFLRQVFRKELGLVPDKALVSQVTIAEYAAHNRLILISDCAVNGAPDFAAKVKIIENAAALAQCLGIDMPKVAVIAPVEVVNPAMQDTIDAAMLAQAAKRGQIKGCIVDGPLALDNALSVEAAETKGIDSLVAGHADLLIMPNLAAGNVLDKALRYFANAKTGSAIMGARIPIVITSRSDSAANKLHAVALAVLQIAHR